MKDPKRTSSDNNPAQPATSPASSALQDTVDGLLTLRSDCLKKLNEIAARVQQRSNQAASDFRRALNEAQLNAQKAQQESFQNYIAAIQSAATQAGASTEMNEVAQRCVKDFEAAQLAAQKSVEEANASVAAGLKEGNDAANREWDEACSEYLCALQERVARIGPGAADPAVLAAVGQSLLWASTHLRKPASR